MPSATIWRWVAQVLCLPQNKMSAQEKEKRSAKCAAFASAKKFWDKIPAAVFVPVISSDMNRKLSRFDLTATLCWTQSQPTVQRSRAERDRGRLAPGAQERYGSERLRVKTSWSKVKKLPGVGLSSFTRSVLLLQSTGSLGLLLPSYSALYSLTSTHIQGAGLLLTSPSPVKR